MYWQPTRGILQPNQHWRRPQDAGGAATVTWNPADIGGNLTLSNSNLDVEKAGGASAAWTSVRATLSKSTGKRYFEITIIGPSADFCKAALADSVESLSAEIGNSSGEGIGFDARASAVTVDGSFANNDNG